MDKFLFRGVNRELDESNNVSYYQRILVIHLSLTLIMGKLSTTMVAFMVSQKLML